MKNTHHSDTPAPLPSDSLPHAGGRDKVSLRELPTRLYGIPNCSTVKKARDWLSQQGIVTEFHDFKKRGLSAETLQHWLQQRDLSELVNRKGLTWRGLTEDQKQQVQDPLSALSLIMEKTSLIKRPVLEQDGKVLHVGFDASAYEKIFNVKD